MGKLKVFVTRKLPAALDKLAKYFEVDVWEGEAPPPKEEIVRRVKDVDALLCLLTDKIDREVIDSAPNLKVIATYSAGYDHIDIEYATKKGIFVTNVPYVLSYPVADLAFGLLLAVARRIVEGDRIVREGRWKVAWSPTFLLGTDVWGKTIGIIGMGTIGKGVAKRAKGFNMKILYYSRRRKPDIEQETGAQFVPLETLLRESDFVVLTVALTPETYHLIGEKELRMMKKSAYLINVSRGAVVDTEALIRALKEGWIAGAALDVFEQEPLPKDHPLTKLPNVVLTPHIGSATIEARSKAAEIAVDSIIKLFRGEVPENLVNKDVLNVRKPEEIKAIP